MVGVNALKDLFIDYVISVGELEGHRQIVTIRDRDDPTFKVECVLTDGLLTEVYFLNNQFYEQEENALLQVMRDIIEGNYMVKSNFLKTKMWIVSKSQNLGPERTTKTDFTLYKVLPKPFLKK